MKKKKSLLGKIWYFIWDDDSILSWFVSVILAFIIIRFIFYPGIGLLTGTSLPVVAVISSSMTHVNGDDWMNNSAYCPRICTQEEWYASVNISKEDFTKFDFNNGFNKGDIIFVRGVSPESVKVGDVIIFQSGKAYPIIHRVVKVFEFENKIYFETKGDNNPGSIVDTELDERFVSEDALLGKGYGRLPYFGYIKIFASELYFAVVKK